MFVESVRDEKSETLGSGRRLQDTATGSLVFWEECGDPLLLLS